MPPPRRCAERVWHYGLWAICILVLGFLILPILVIVPLSFSSGTFLTFPLPGLSLRWYEEFFTSAPWQLVAAQQPDRGERHDGRSRPCSARLPRSA